MKCDNSYVFSQAALDYARCGWAVLPLKPRDKKPPLVSEWERRASCELSQVREWARQYPRANIGVHCGKSGLVVIDVDPRNGGSESLGLLESQHGPMWEAGGLEARTAGGGRHFVFKVPKGANLPAKATLGPGIDLLHGNHYFVVAPSVRDVGAYAWELGCSPIDAGALEGMADLPAWAYGDLVPLSMERQQGEKVETALSIAEIPWQPVPDLPSERARLQQALCCVEPDCGNDDYLTVCSAVISTGWSDAHSILESWASGSLHGRAATKYDEREHSRRIRKLRPDGGVTVGSLYALAARNGFDTSRALPASKRDTYGDISNGNRFASKFRGRFLFVHAVGKWMEYDGMCWKWCVSGEALAAAKQIALEALDEAHATLRDDPSDRAKSNYAHAMAVHRNARRLDAMLTMAASEDGMSLAHQGELDADPMLLGVRNGVVNLRIGTLLATDPAMWISRQAGADYHREAECPRWLQFLSDVFEGDAEVIGLVQRALGYSLTGLVDEEVMFFLQGSGANGKSVFANIVQAILGDYAVTVRAALLARDAKGSSSDAEREKARLPGARMALINEVGLSDAWDDLRLKEMVSRERVSARMLYGESFEFMPSHAIWMRGNHQPIAIDSGDGFWRRIVMIPFARQFAESERVPDLDRRILESERNGILAWMVEGCLAWQREGLRIPARIKAEGEAYRKDSDVLGEWLDVRCEQVAGSESVFTSLYADYSRYLDDIGMRPPSGKVFGKQVKARHFSSRASNGKRLIQGIRLRPLDL